VAKFVVVDTDILIDVGRGVDKAVEYVQGLEHRGQLAISVVTESEPDSESATGVARCRRVLLNPKSATALPHTTSESATGVASYNVRGCSG